MKMTYRIAHSIGMDAANRQLRAARRKVWNEEDFNFTAATLNLLFPLCAELLDARNELCGCQTSARLINLVRTIKLDHRLGAGSLSTYAASFRE